MSKFSLTLVAVFLAAGIFCQSVSLSVIPNTTISNAPAVHSGAFGVFDDTWFCIGGRQNGLHGFQPPFAFPGSGINETIYFTNPATNQTWSSSTTLLPVNIREAITSSNMQFYLADTMLYMVGGYGWKDSIQNFITWPTLTAVNMKGLKTAVINGQTILPYFRQIQDSVLAVCGAHIHKLDSFYYLVFGHRFDGYYDRTDTTGFHVQIYSHEIRKFKIQDDGIQLSINSYSAIRDTANFRRRDYNLLPQVFPGGKVGLTAFSGVFLKGIDLPYLTCIDITDTGYSVRNDFNQTLSQYHSATAQLYDSVSGAQHNLFFGGMSMYYRDTVSGLMVTDSQVPFVSTISAVTRNSANQLTEYDLNILFPALLGTNAYFLRDINVPLYKHDFIDYSKLQNQQRIGFIIGGIESPELNINSTDPSLSSASSRVFEVIVNKDTPSSAIPVANDLFNLYCYPNPAKDKMNLRFDLQTAGEVIISVYSSDGKLIKLLKQSKMEAGSYNSAYDISDLADGSYTVTVLVNNQKKAIRFVKR